MNHKIICTIGSFTPKAQAILESIGDVTLTETLNGNLEDATCFIVQLGVNITRDVIDSAPNLKIIATATTGLDHIDVSHAESKGITVLSLKGETEFLNSITATAELALGLLISLVRKIPIAHASVIHGKWDREGHRGHSLSGKTLGVIGYGRLGKMMALYGEALGMKVIYSDPNEPDEISVLELLPQSDVISVHVHLDDGTENMIDADALQLVRPGAVLINTARGKIVNEQAVIEALESGALAGYATDVLSNELDFEDSQATGDLIEYAQSHDNVLITPHIGGTTVEAREATDVFIARKLANSLRHA
jgi:D-3-phosphoglycerate dehydrogenase